MTLFAGLSAFPLTPTDAEGRLLPDVMARQLDRLAGAGVASVGLLGSTGSYAYLAPAERRDVLRLAVRALAGRVPLIVGVGALRSDDAALLARDAARAGADGLLLAPVSYQRLTEEEVFHLVETVAQAGGLPLCLYNNPTTTNFTFSPALIARLAQLPQVAAVKMPLPSGGDFAAELADLRPRLPAGFAIGYSGDWGAGDALLAGADGWFSVVAGLLPEPALRLTRAAQAGDAPATRQADQGFAPLWSLFREFGSFRVMYALAGLLDDARIAPIRPVLPLPAAALPRVKVALEHLSGRSA